MKKKTIKKRILAGLLVFSLIVPANVHWLVYMDPILHRRRKHLLRSMKFEKKHVKQEIYGIRGIPADIFSHRIMFP